MTTDKIQDFGAFAPWAPSQPLTAPELQALTLLKRESVASGHLVWIEQGTRAQAAEVWHLAEGAFGLALRAALQLHGISSNDVLNTATRLATVQCERGNLNGARALQHDVLKRRRRRHGLRHAASLAAERELAATLCMMGLFEDARRHQEHVLGCYMTAAGERDPITAAAMAALGDTLLSMGDETEASRLLGQALDNYRCTHGPEHAVTLRAEDSFAAALWVRQDFAAARALQEHVRACLPREGISRHDALVFENNLAATLMFQGEMEAARAIQEHVLVTRTQFCGSQHPITIGARANFAWTLRAQGDALQARRLCDENLDLARRQLGAGHPVVFAIESVLAEALCDLDDEAALRHLALEGLAALPSVSASARRIFARYPFLLRVLAVQAAAGSAPEWMLALLELLPTTSAAFRDALELRPVQERGAALAHYVDFHTLWVELCAAWAPHRLPQAIAPLHGLESWSAVLLRLQGADFASLGVAQASLLQAQRELQQLRVCQASLTSIVDSAIQHIADLEAMLRRATNGDLAEPLPRLKIDESVVAGLQLELDSHLAQRAQQRDQETEALHRYRDARAELARSDPTLTALTAMPELTSHDLAARLAPREALLITIALPKQRVAVLVVRPQALDLIEVDELPSVTALAQRYQFHHRALTRGAGLRDGLLAPVEASPAGGPSVAGDRIATAQLQQAVRRIFWRPLVGVLREVQRVHLITGPGHHSLPFECGSPPGLPVHRYFGLPSYLSLRDRPLPLSAPGAVDIVVDAAWGRTPIPFVEAEAELVRELLSPQSRVRRVSGRRFLEGRTQATQLLLCLHGGVSGQPGQEHGFLLVDTAAAQLLTLDPPKVATLSTRITEVYASACLGAVVGSNDSGAALGLCSEWQLRGVTAVVACLAPVEDHFMPLLTAMFWLRRRSGQPPYDALQGAKEDLMRGDWPDAAQDPLRRAYRRTMRRVLQRAQWRDAEGDTAAREAARSVTGWLLPPYVRASYFDNVSFDDLLHREFSSACCEGAQARERLISQCLSYLIDERARPEDAAVRPFAQAAIDNICAVTHCFGSGGATGSAGDMQ